MKRPVKQNWFQTLNAALESEGLVDHWQFGLNVGYGEYVRHLVEISPQDGRRKAKYMVIFVYRNTDGLYERPCHYKC